MSKQDQKEIDFAMYTIVEYLKWYIKDVNHKFKELEERVNRPKSDDKVKTLKDLKENQEAETKRFHDFTLNFSEPDSLESLKDMNAFFKSFQRQEDYLNGRFNELMIEFSKSGDLKEDPGVSTAVKGGILSKSGRKAEEGRRVLMQAFERLKIQEDYESETSKSGRKGEEGGGVLKKGLKIQEGYVANKMNDGSDIGGQRVDVSDSKSKELCIEFLAPAFDRSGHDSDVNREKVTESSTSYDLGSCTNIEGLEQKISSLISETKWLFEKDKDNEKNSLIDWLKILKATKDRAVKLGTELFFLLVDLRFIMAEREELMAKFQEFKSSLELQETASVLASFSVMVDENFMVIKMIIEVLEMADGELRKMKESEKLKLKEMEINVSKVKEGLIEASQIDHLLFSILKGALNLEYVLLHPWLPDLHMSKRYVICWEEFNAIDKRIDELKKSFTVIFGSEEMERVGFCTRALQGTIKEMWNQFGES